MPKLSGRPVKVTKSGPSCLVSSRWPRCLGFSEASAWSISSIAQAGMKCIVLDADFRKPKLHKLFGVSNEVGLASVIASGADLEDCIQQCDAPGLSVLPCGSLPPNPAELLMAPRFREVLDVL